MVVGEDEAEANLMMILEKLLLCVWNFCISRQYYLHFMPDVECIQIPASRGFRCNGETPAEVPARRDFSGTFRLLGSLLWYSW